MMILCKLGIHDYVTLESKMTYNILRELRENPPKEYINSIFLHYKNEHTFTIDDKPVEKVWKLNELKVCSRCYKVIDEISLVRNSILKKIKEAYEKRIEYNKKVERVRKYYENSV